MSQNNLVNTLKEIVDRASNVINNEEQNELRRLYPSVNSNKRAPPGVSSRTNTLTNVSSNSRTNTSTPSHSSTPKNNTFRFAPYKTNKGKSKISETMKDVFCSLVMQSLYQEKPKENNCSNTKPYGNSRKVSKQHG